MFWRLPTRQQYLRQKGEANKRAMCSLVEIGCVPGLLAYAGDEPVGWCAVALREAYPALERSPSRKAIDAEHVWSITCLYVSRAHRRRHLSTRLIEAAVRHVRSRGGCIVEAYPVPPKPRTRSTNYACTGFVSAFERAGFSECARFKTRPIMRYYALSNHRLNQAPLPMTRAQRKTKTRRHFPSCAGPALHRTLGLRV